MVQVALGPDAAGERVSRSPSPEGGAAQRMHQWMIPYFQPVVLLMFRELVLDRTKISSGLAEVCSGFLTT